MVGEVRSLAPGKPRQYASPTPRRSKLASPSRRPGIATAAARERRSESKPPQKPVQNPRADLAYDDTCPAAASSAREQRNPGRAKMDEAIKKQEDLLAEFDKVADELKKASWRSSKAALWSNVSRRRRGFNIKVAGRLGDQVNDLFGLAAARSAGGATQCAGPDFEQETKEGDKISLIMDDMDAYYDRHRFVKIKSVLDDMRKQDVVGNLRELAGDLKNRKGTVDRPVRVLVRHARSLGRGSGRPRLLRHVSGLQIARGASRPRSCWKCCKSSRAR